MNCTTVTSRHTLFSQPLDLGTAGSEDVALPDNLGRRMLQRLKRWGSLNHNLVPRLFPLVEQRPWSELVT